MSKNVIYTVLGAVALMAVLNKFDVTRGLIGGGNKYFN